MKMKKHGKASYKTRSKRVVSESVCSPEEMGKWAIQSSYKAHKTSGPVVNAVCHRESQPERILSGGSDGQVLLYNVNESKVERNYTGHKKAVNALIYHPSRDVVVSASDDKTVRMWVDGRFFIRLFNHSLT